MFVDEHPEWPGTDPRTDLKYLGYWRPNGRVPKSMKSYPSPDTYVDEGWDPAERELVARFLDTGGEVLHRWHGSSNCRFCGIRPIFRLDDGTEDFSVDYTDGVYAWPGGLSHYVRHHAVRPPGTFVRHVLQSVSSAVQ